MATDPNTRHDPAPTREREVIVTNDGGRSGMSGVVVAVLAIIVLAIIGVVVVNAIGGATDGGDAPAVEVPSEVNIDTGEGG